ncbi:MAG: hypothetical protein ACK44D_06135 [Bacteroidia bacterium]|jgi:hypothetical protein
MELIIIYPVFIGMGVATAELARQKGYKARWWLLFGTLIPIISTIILFLLKNKQAHIESLPIKQPDVTHNDKILYQKPV